MRSPESGAEPRPGEVEESGECSTLAPDMSDTSASPSEEEDDMLGNLPDPSEMDNASYGGVPNGRV